MPEWSDLLSTGMNAATAEQALLCMLCSFVLGQCIAVVYQKTYQGLSYSRSFVQTLVLGAIVSTILMLAIGDNLARGLGILGTMALVRFRTNVRDTRDMIFIFASLAIGVASGVQAFAIALVGALFFCLAAITVEWGPVGRAKRFDGLLRFWLPQSTPGERAIDVLKRHCRSHVLVAIRDVAQGNSLEYAYQVKLKDLEAHDALINALSELDGIGGLTLMIQDAHTEL